MQETKNNEPCCEKNNAAPSCSCLSDERDGSKPVGRKPLKVIICLVVLLAAVSIVGYRTIGARNNSSCIVSNNTAAFTFGQPASKPMPSKENPIPVGQNLGEDLKSLNELNTVAVNKDAVFVFIPASGNVLIDDTTKTAITEAQQALIRNKITVGLYTLSCDSPDYSKITQQAELPAIFVARKGAKAVLIPGSNVNVKTLLQAYQACCDAASSGCCPS